MDPTVLMEETVTMLKALRPLQLFLVLLDHKGKQVPRVQMAQTVELDLQEQQDLQVQLEVVQLVHKVQRVLTEAMAHPVQRD
jgi:23S rRNA pseudoU1915 N3-methylase RlmH